MITTLTIILPSEVAERKVGAGEKCEAQTHDVEVLVAGLDPLPFKFQRHALQKRAKMWILLSELWSLWVIYYTTAPYTSGYQNGTLILRNHPGA